MIDHLIAIKYKHVIYADTNVIYFAVNDSFAVKNNKRPFTTRTCDFEYHCLSDRDQVIREVRLLTILNFGALT